MEIDCSLDWRKQIKSSYRKVSMSLYILKLDKSFLLGDVLKILSSGIVETNFGIGAQLGAVLTYLISTSCKSFKTKQLDQLQ